MKAKWLGLTLVVLLSLFAVTACGSDDNNGGDNEAPANNTENEVNNEVEENANEPANNEENDVAEGAFDVEDGRYFAQEDDFSASGWKSYVNIDVENGSIVSAEWNATNQIGLENKMDHAANGDYGMAAASDIDAEWDEQAQATVDFLIETQDTAAVSFDEEGKTDEISGATMTTDGFFELVEDALAAGPVTEGPFTDGFYTASEPDAEEEGDWASAAYITVVNGHIIEAVWNAYDIEGQDKFTHAKDGEYGMINASEIDAEWHEQAEAAAQHLVETQDATAVDWDEEGKTDEISGATMTVSYFFELAEEALADAQ